MEKVWGSQAGFVVDGLKEKGRLKENPGKGVSYQPDFDGESEGDDEGDADDEVTEGDGGDGDVDGMGGTISCQL